MTGYVDKSTVPGAGYANCRLVDGNLECNKPLVEPCLVLSTVRRTIQQPAVVGAWFNSVAPDVGVSNHHNIYIQQLHGVRCLPEVLRVNYSRPGTRVNAP